MGWHRPFKYFFRRGIVVILYNNVAQTIEITANKNTIVITDYNNS